MNYNVLKPAILFGAMVFAACSQADRTVENPLVNVANTTTVDIVRVDLTDTATVLHVNANYIPHYWITIASDCHIDARGKKYAMTGTDGIQADSLFWMPESGRASFRLMFEPLPKNTRSFDFIEGDCDDCFKLFGIDLTGKTEYDAPKGIPADVLKPDTDASVPDPVFKTGETTVKIHLLNYRKELGEKIFLYINHLFSRQEEISLDIDPETATAQAKFWQYGPAQGFIVTNSHSGSSNIWFAPGEDIDVYVDMRLTGWVLTADRNRENPEKAVCFQSTYSSGVYGNLTNVNGEKRDRLYSMNLNTGEFADYDMTADEYSAHVISIYKSLSDSIAGSTLPPLKKELDMIGIRQEAISAFAQNIFLREHNYRLINNKWRGSIPIKIEPLGPEHYKTLCSIIDINDPKLLMGTHSFEYIKAIASPDVDWAEAAGIKDGIVPAIKITCRLSGMAENAELTDKDIEELESTENPFFAEALKSMQANAEASLAAMKGKSEIQETPKVNKEKLFDAIIAPYRGKVVLVDFWNTWCAPCRYALEHNEPLKDSELKSDDIVWIYIANETSPMVKYMTMIPDIKGIHYRLNAEQWKYLCDKFNIDGIPSYVLADKSGRYSLRNDFRDHDLMVKTLKGMIE